MRIFWFCLMLAASVAHAGDAAYTVRATELRAKPFTDAAALANLPEGSKVETLERKASWMQIRSEAATGWVRLLDLRFGDAGAKKSGDSGLGALFNVAAGGSSSVSTGVRGLSEEKLKNAQPNPEELKKLQHHAASKSAAQQFAHAGGLAARQLDYLATPEVK